MSALSKGPSNRQTLVFMVMLCFACALVLSILSSSLKEKQELAEELNKSQEMLIAARIYHPDGYFLLRNENGEFVPAKYDKEANLLPGKKEDIASPDEVFQIYKARIGTFLVDSEGRETTFENEGLDRIGYLSEHKKSGYAKLPLKLVFHVSPNGTKVKNMADSGISPDAYIIPVNGFALWDAVYGFLALEPDGNTVRGISWYDHKETPGLGANIASPQWQRQFPGKAIFQEGAGDFSAAPLGITIVRGKVIEVFGNTPKAKSAVDGMPGATLTGNGIMKAYKDVLAHYRPFLISLHEKSIQKHGS